MYVCSICMCVCVYLTETGGGGITQVIIIAGAAGALLILLIVVGVVIMCWLIRYSKPVSPALSWFLCLTTNIAVVVLHGKLMVLLI